MLRPGVQRCLRTLCMPAALLAATAAARDIPGGLVELRPDEPSVTVEKVPVTDSRAVRGFLGTPVDGSVSSWGYRGAICEYPDTGKERYDAGAGVDYAFNGNDGLHLTFADDAGFDLVVLRGGAKTRLYADDTELVEPRNAAPLHEFNGSAPVQHARFPARVAARKASLFGVRDGAVADAGFFRIHRSGLAAQAPQWLHLTAQPLQLPEPASKFAADSVVQALPERYPGSSGPVYATSISPPADGRIRCRASVPAHFLTTPTGARSGLDAVQFDLVIGDASAGFALTAVVQDPLDPRLDLVWVDFTGPGNGRYRFRLDVPDQILFEQTPLWVTLIFDRNITVSGVDGRAPLIGIEAIPVERALPEAIAHRKFLLKSFFIILSEARRWGGYRNQSREEFYPWAGTNYPEMSRHISELFLTLDICQQLAPEDEKVRQYREWVYLRNLDRLSEVPPPPGPPPGVPAWAWYARLGWLEVRRIAEWWLDERLVPSGEFGGMVGDDSDLYQQFTDLPHFENDGVGARVKEAAARLAELAARRNLRGGVNLLETDALHAYEEGMNHLALMSRWFYGDPIHYERCLESAASMGKLTVRTPDGRRHIPHSRKIGYSELEHPTPPTVEGGSTPLLWHPALQAAEYNRNPGILTLLDEWADTWLRHQRPGHWATEMDVPSGKVTAFDARRPFSGRAQNLTFLWLYRLTGDSKHIGPLLHFHRQGQAPPPSEDLLNDLYNLGALDDISPGALRKLAAQSPALHCLITGDAVPMIEALIGSPVPGNSSISSLYAAQRWPDMYTETHIYNDRIFMPIGRYPATAYLGGYSYRNRYVPANAVSWEGFGTDYGALVTTHRPDHLEAMVFNFRDAPMEGTMRIWALRHGVYRIETGLDADGDNRMDVPLATGERELARADGVPLTLAPRSVTAVRITQLKELDDITARPDLALAAREIKWEDGALSGVIHNIGSKPVERVTIGVRDGDGTLRARAELGALAAPNDLQPKRLSFVIKLPAKPDGRWQVMLDPENTLLEIYEGNNSARFDELAAFQDVPAL